MNGNDYPGSNLPRMLIQKCICLEEIFVFFCIFPKNFPLFSQNGQIIWEKYNKKNEISQCRSWKVIIFFQGSFSMDGLKWVLGRHWAPFWLKKRHQLRVSYVFTWEVIASGLCGSVSMTCRLCPCLPFHDVWSCQW